MAKRIDLSELEKRADWKSWAVTGSHVLLVLAPVYATAYWGWHWWWILMWAWCGVLMNGLLNLMHECAHFHTFRKRELSDAWGQWVLGPLLLADFEAYRHRHWEHHKHLGVNGDTKDAYLVEITGGKVFLVLGRCLVLREALRKFASQVGEKSGAAAEVKRGRIWVARTAVTQAIFAGSILLTAWARGGQALWPDAVVTAAAAYGVVYLYGLATLTVFMANLRAIAEHQVEPGTESAHGRAALRNFRCGPAGRLFFGAYGFAEHATHHLEPGIPYYHLRESTAEMAKTDRSLEPARSYFAELTLLARQSGKS